MEHEFSSTWNGSSEHHADAMVTQRVQLSALGSVSPSIHPSVSPPFAAVHSHLCHEKDWRSWLNPSPDVCVCVRGMFAGGGDKLTELWESGTRA